VRIRERLACHRGQPMLQPEAIRRRANAEQSITSCIPRMTD
jgi:hypothetical protein